MSFFWFFVGILTVALALRHIKRSPEANPVVPHHAPCCCGCHCEGHDAISPCKPPAETAHLETR